LPGYSAIGDLTDSVQEQARLLQNKLLKKSEGAELSNKVTLSAKQIPREPGKALRAALDKF
jgi:hypothetical protein